MNLSDYLNKLKQTEPTVAVPQAVSNMKNEYYDYGGYRDKYGEFDMSGGKHLTDEFKLPAHMTFSDDSIYILVQVVKVVSGEKEKTTSGNLLHHPIICNKHLFKTYKNILTLEKLIVD
jgi:hypothetical protein